MWGVRLPLEVKQWARNDRRRHFLSRDLGPGPEGPGDHGSQGRRDDVGLGGESRIVLFRSWEEGRVCS